MEFTAENLQKEIVVNQVKTTAIQFLQDKIEHGENYKKRWSIIHSNPIFNTNLLIVQDSMRNKVLTVDLVNIKNNKYWVIESLLEIGFNILNNKLNSYQIALQQIATGEIIGQQNNHKDTLYICRDIAKNVLEKQVQ